jgi:cytosine/adenosine deaminase-related metal-dependent hydrolase
MDPERRVLEPGTVVIEDQFIADVGPPTAVDTAGCEIIDVAGSAVLPGFVNTHTHVPQTLLRGGASHDRKLLDWLFNVLYPGLAAYTPEDIRAGTLLYCAEALRAGITTVVDNEDLSPTDFAQAAAVGVAAMTEAGIRAIYARMFFDVARPELADLFTTLQSRSPETPVVTHTATTDSILADLDRLISTHDGAANGRIRVWPAPSMPFQVSERAIRASQDIAKKRNAGWTMHVSQDRIESRLHWMNTPEYLHDRGCLDDRLLAAHCVHIGPRDIRLFRHHDVKVSTQPSSNSYLAAGVAPVPDLIANGVSVGIGTDDPNCNDAINMLGDMKMLALLHRATREDASILTPEKILEMATIDGARCIGMENEIGSLEPGKRADVITIDLMRHAQTVPAFDIPATLVFQAYGNEVDTVIVDGEIVMRDRRLRFLPTDDDEQAFFREASERAAAVLARARIAGSRSWRVQGL